MIRGVDCLAGRGKEVGKDDPRNRILNPYCRQKVSRFPDRTQADQWVKCVRSSLDFIPGLLQLPEDFLHMRGTAGFQFDFDPAEMDREVSAAAMMGDMDHVGRDPGDDGGEGSG